MSTFAWQRVSHKSGGGVGIVNFSTHWRTWSIGRLDGQPVCPFSWHRDIGGHSLV